MTALAVGSIVLASASVARGSLLQHAGLAVLRDPSDIDEAEIKAACRRDGLDAARCATALAKAKAMRVSQRHAGALVIGADQILVCGERWLDKPRDRNESREQLQALRGKRHELVTAAMVVRNGVVLWRHVDRPSLTMRRFSDAFLEAYLDTVGDAALGAVGAYQLEGLGAQLFARIEGDYFSILGLPLLPLLDFLRGHGAMMP